MQLTLYTDYSLRVLLYLAEQPETRATIAEIADFHDISRNHLVKVAHHLAQCGFVLSHRGKNGGLQLARPAKEISVGGVVRQSEPHFHIVECFDQSSNRCRVTKRCALKHILRRAQQEFLATLDSYRLVDLVGPSDRSQPLFAQLPQR